MAQQFFTIEVYFLHGSDTGRHLYRNFTGKELKNLRETIIAAGGTGVVVKVKLDDYFFKYLSADMAKILQERVKVSQLELTRFVNSATTEK